MSDQERTVTELVKAMNSLVSYLQFEGESSEMFSSGRLPTLDTEIWYDPSENQVKYCFYEKPMCPNKVLQKDTALAESSVRASLVQEVVRRLKGCAENLSNDEKQRVLSEFSTKLVNSGHSLSSSQIILVHGTTRYNKLIQN